MREAAAPRADDAVDPIDSLAAEARGLPALGEGERLEWRKTGFRAREWTLLRRGESVADLVPSEWRRFDARGEAGAGVWLIRRPPWRLTPRLDAVESVSGRWALRYQGLGWRRGRLERPGGGETLHWRKRWGHWNVREVRTADGAPLLSLRHSALRPTSRGTVELHEAAAGREDLPLLILLSWYLHLRIHASPVKPFGGGRRGWEPWEGEG